LQIVYNPAFRIHFGIIWDYIASDSRPSANRFRQKLEVKLKRLENFPYKFRKSFYYDNDNIRDFIFKGYTIPYLVNTDKNQIVILDIFKWIDK
jgi:plasmid stabilization system protein ParE